MNYKSSEHKDQPRSPLVERGQRIYDQRLKADLEPSHVGQFVAIEPKSGRYFLHESGSGAAIAAHNAMPGSLFYLMRIGYRTADTVGGYGSKTVSGN